MPKAKLETILSPIVRRYGIERVEQCLRQMESSNHRRIHSKRSSRGETVSRKEVAEKSGAKKTGARKARVDATVYIDKMKLPPEKRSAVSDLARRFENKSFLPTYRDIVDFCEMYGIDVPASRSRGNAVPRVFKFIAGMEADDIQGILDRGMFSGPSQLGPISDAIRHHRRHEPTALSSATRTTASSCTDMEIDGVQRRP